jgi:hypothetical protein
MKLILHRLLLAIVWVPTIGIELVMLYDFKRDVTLLQMLQDHYQAFLIFLCVALFLSLLVNWIMSGDMNNWAGKIWKS